MRFKRFLNLMSILSYITEFVQLEPSSSSDEQEISTQFVLEDHVIDEPDFVDEAGPSSKKARGTQQVVTTKLVATLDNCKVSDRDAARIILSVAEALGHNLDDLVVNRSSIRRYRYQLRAERNKKLYEAFQENVPKMITVHWDGKLLPRLTGKETVERLPVIITYDGKEKLLGIPAIEKCTGREQALTVLELLDNWKLTDSVKVLCCDTTSTNMGRLKGACVILEQILDQDLLYFPCRHHVYELVLRSVFELKMSKSSAPDVPLFKKFQKAWSTINKSNYRSCVEDTYVCEKLQDTNLILDFCFHTINQKHPRGDYVEFLEVMIIFLGGTLTKGNSFKVPGAFHHARWMAKAIYVLKIYLFREEFLLSNEEIGSIKDICLFIANLYIKAWFNVPIAANAPSQDLQFLQQFYKYKDVDKRISEVAVQKFSGHLWYLIPECATLAFFNSELSCDIKRRMIQNLDSNQTEISSKRIVLKDVKNYINIGIENFISSQSRNFFSRFHISTDFLQKDPSVWETDETYKNALEIIKNLKVVNDSAERGVKLITEYNSLLTKDENNKQFILQVLEDYRRCYPDASKSTLMKGVY